MKRFGAGQWAVVLCLVMSVGALSFLAGRRSAGEAVHVRTERAAPEAEIVEIAEAADAASEAALPAEPAADAPQTAANDRLNLNTATKEDLMTLPRIGEKLAERILTYRAQYGRFVTTEQLMDVDGIGEGIYEALRELVTAGEDGQ